MYHQIKNIKNKITNKEKDCATDLRVAQRSSGTTLRPLGVVKTNLYEWPTHSKKPNGYSNEL